MKDSRIFEDQSKNFKEKQLQVVSKHVSKFIVNNCEKNSMVGPFRNASLRYGKCVYDMPIIVGEVLVLDDNEKLLLCPPRNMRYEIINPDY